MQRVSGVISVGGMYVNAVADNINSGFLDVGDGIGTGKGMVNITAPIFLYKSTRLKHFFLTQAVDG